MAVWIHFTLHAASLVSLFVVKPRRDALEAIRHLEAFASGYDPDDRGPVVSLKADGEVTRNTLTRAGHV